MSSDYLNYELSKELHDLGVVFGKPTRWWTIYETTDRSLCLTDKGIFKDKIPAPSTAQLIDEIIKRSEVFYFDYEKSIKCYCVEVDSGEGKDPCATTALGKSLVALVKEDS